LNTPTKTAPPTQPDGARGNDKHAAKPRPKSGRRRAREFALQGLYEWQLGKSEVAQVDANIRELEEWSSCDRAHFDALLHGCIAESAELDALLTPHLDRKTSELSPVEHGVLWIGTFELKHCVDVPYRVAINEAVELAKSFGGTDGHKYVNGVLDKAAAELRPAEVALVRTQRR
jgi:transcription antitermination protein NusB